MSELQTFEFYGVTQEISLVDIVQVAEGVVCEVYEVVGHKEYDLGIITVRKGHKTPLQRVVDGTRTIEGYVSGQGELTVTTLEGDQSTYRFNGEEDEFGCVEVIIGDTMQWTADAGSDLVFYEICEPPYEDGRFENINDRN